MIAREVDAAARPAADVMRLGPAAAPSPHDRRGLVDRDPAPGPGWSAAMPVTTRYARSKGTSIAYQVVGQGARDIVLVPCAISHVESLWEEPRFVRFVGRLASFGRVMLFDKRGTGLSDPTPADEPLTLEQRMDDLLAVLDAAGSERAVVLGVSFGSALAALFAATHPRRTAALIMYGGVAKRTWAPDYPWAPTDEEHERYRERIGHEWGGPFDLERFAPSLLGDERFRSWWAAYLRRGASPAAALATDRVSAETDIRDVLPRIQAPTLVLHRAGDRLTNAAEGRYLAARIAGAAFVELPGGDHIPFAGDQDALLDEVESFLTGSRPAPRVEGMLATVLVAELIDPARTAAQLGDGRWGDLRAAYRALVRETIDWFRGRAVSESLDGVVATFDGPARAIRCAEAIAEGARRLGLRQRSGLHTGAVEISGREVGGLAVHVASRIAAHAEAGEVLVSGTVKDLVAGSGLAFEDVPDRDVAGLPTGWTLARVARATALGVATGATPEPLSEAMPAPPSSLSPREREVATLLTRGLSNRQMAEELAISVATVERHVANILAKLGHRSRAQIAAWAVGQGTPRVQLVAPS